jgi:hypothetical protein
LSGIRGGGASSFFAFGILNIYRKKFSASPYKWIFSRDLPNGVSTL